MTEAHADRFALVTVHAGCKFLVHESQCECLRSSQCLPRALFWNGSEWEPAFDLRFSKPESVHWMERAQGIAMVGEELARWAMHTPDR